MDDKNKSKSEKHTKDGWAYDYRKHRSNGQTTFQPGDNSKKTKGCFICDGPHRALECQKKEWLNAILVEEGPTQQTEEVAIFNSLQLLNTILVQTDVGNEAIVTAQLTLVMVKVNGLDIVVMVLKLFLSNDRI